MEPTCENCRFSAALPERSVCRRYPPMPVTTEFAWRGATYFEADRADAVWPCTSADDWCGEHQPHPTPKEPS